jgi:hypothetical protein
MSLLSALSKLVQNKNAALAHSAFAIRENKLCAELGVSKDELRKRRQLFLAQGQHWDYVDKRVLFNAVGAEVLRKTAHSDLRGLQTAPASQDRATEDSETRRPLKGLLLEKNPPPVAFTGQLVAWAMPSHNQHLLIAYLPDADPLNPMNLVTCTVRSNLHFVRGMKLPGPGRQIRQIDQQRYELLGDCPRWRGKW